MQQQTDDIVAITNEAYGWYSAIETIEGAVQVGRTAGSQKF